MADVLKEHIEQCPEHPLSHAKAELERLRRFISERVKCEMVWKQGGYHGRRLFMEAEKLMDDPTYFPGASKDGTNGA